MNRSIRTAAIGLFGGAMALAVATGTASASQGPKQGHPGDQQSTQLNGIGQAAGAAAQSKQVLPTNFNLAPSLLSVGSNDGWVTQGNGSSANANAWNGNKSLQGNGAVQQSQGPLSPQGFGPTGPQGSPGPQGSEQSSTQGNGIGQVAGAVAQSKQILPTNVNVAPSLLSVGSNDGWVKQGNASSANANAGNDNKSVQGNGAVQQSQGNPGPQGAKPDGFDGKSGPQGPPQGGPGPQGSEQSSTQGNGIGQVAGAAAKSTQVAPANVNVAPSILSVDSGNGSVSQGNASSANANAGNDNRSVQGNGAVQQSQGNPAPQGPQGPPCPQGNEPQGNSPEVQSPQGQGPQGNSGPEASQSSEQGNGIGQVAGAAAKSTQVAPANVNVAPSILSVDSGNGGVAQGNGSSANANAGNSNASAQGNLLGQSAGGPSGLID